MNQDDSGFIRKGEHDNNYAHTMYVIKTSTKTSGFFKIKIIKNKVKKDMKRGSIFCL